ncbi:4-oxalocrotonate tautomerase family protein [bacterium]|jgi:4-oxalocrotonate tautomerase|nr:4-oxalocrotonate tautomerase family protein [bacterium]
MPYINVRVAGKLNREQKEKIVDQLTTTMETVAKKPREATYITIDEVPRENWAKSGKLLE